MKQLEDGGRDCRVGHLAFSLQNSLSTDASASQGFMEAEATCRPAVSGPEQMSFIPAELIQTLVFY